MSSAVQYLHNQGIVVVDCSPSSFVITRTMIVKLSHLAISSEVMELGSKATLVTRYASPESLSGHTRSKTKESDIFTLGTSLWHLMTGRAPFPFLQSDVGKQRNERGIHFHSPPIVQYHSDVLQTLISDCCQVEPNLRPNIEEVVARLGAGKLTIRGMLY